MIERSVIVSDGKIIDIDSLPSTFKSFFANKSTGKEITAFDLANAEKKHIENVINYTNGNKTEAARLLNIAITTLYRKLNEYHIGNGMQLS